MARAQTGGEDQGAPMPAEGPIRGVLAACLTPLLQDLSCDTAGLAAHIGRLLDQGCDGVALFGTTGEGPAFSVEERIEAMHALVGLDIPMDRVMVGTGAVALPDAARLTRQAVIGGCHGVLVVPPFFFRDVGDDGVFRSYAELVEQVGDSRLRLYLYNCPAVSGITIGYSVIERLVAAYSDVVAGIKDSSGDWDYLEGLVRRFPGLSTYCGAEPLLPRLVEAGGAGAISGMANVIPRHMRQLYDTRPATADAPVLATVSELVAAVTAVPVVPALKCAAAYLTGEPGWHRLRSPLAPLDEAAARQLQQAFAAAGIAPGAEA